MKKLIVLLFLSAIFCTSIHAQSKYQPPSVIKMCHEMYLSAVKQCDQMYLVNNIGTLCGLCKDPTMAGVAEAATTFFVDSWNWVDCYDAAGNKEKRCWRTGKWQ